MNSHDQQRFSPALMSSNFRKLDDAKTNPAKKIHARLLGANYMLYGVYQDWVHQNPGEHLDEGIAEDSKWQVRWKTFLYSNPTL